MLLWVQWFQLLKTPTSNQPRDFSPKASIGFDVSDVGSWGGWLVVFVVFLFSTNMNGEIAAKRGKYLMYIYDNAYISYHISIIHITCIYI